MDTDLRWHRPGGARCSTAPPRALARPIMCAHLRRRFVTPGSATSSASGAIHPIARSRSIARRTRSRPYGGSRNTKPHCSPAGAVSTSIAITEAWSSARHPATLPRRATTPCDLLHERGCAAPRDSASSPNAPVPANASKTRALDHVAVAPGACSSMSNSACRTRSAVGRVACPVGAMICGRARRRRRCASGLARHLVAQHPRRHFLDRATPHGA